MPAKLAGTPRNLALIACLALSSVRILTPAPNRTIHGLVTNQGEPIRGAVVELEDEGTLEVRSYITQQDGQYHFGGLRQNVEYRIWATRAEKRSPKKTVSQFNEKESVIVDLVLE